MVFALIMLNQTADAQLFDENMTVNYDTNYVKVYRDELTTRIFLSRKQTGYTLSDRLIDPGLRYRTNDNLLLGLGYTYSFLTINLSVKMPFINTDDEIYGTSNYLDLSTHAMFRSFKIDLYFQWNKGYYVSNPGKYVDAWETGDPVPKRGDLRTNMIGINIQHLFNSRRYSYKASFQQNEFQRKSAGSPLAGVEAYWMLGMADSTLVPGMVPGVDYLGNIPFNQTDLFNFGINGGYAYTYVWKEQLYVSVATVFGLSGGKHLIHSTSDSFTSYNGLSAGITNDTRISVGYNNNNYYVGLSFVRFSMNQIIPGPGDWISYTSSNIRLNFVKRFTLKKTIKILRPDLWIF